MLVERPGVDKQPRVLHYLTPILAGILLAISLVVLIEWFSGYVRSVGHSLTRIPMSPLTAILFLLTGIALLLLRQQHEGQVSLGLIRSVSVFVLLVSSCLLLQNLISALPTDIEGLLTAPTTSESGLIIVRMSPITTRKSDYSRRVKTKYKDFPTKTEAPKLS